MSRQEKRAESALVVWTKGWGNSRCLRKPSVRRWAKKMARRASRRLGRARCLADY